MAGYFSDPDSTDLLTFTATGLPPGLSLDPVTGRISGTLAGSASAASPYSVTITAMDPSGATCSQTVGWTVLNPAPVAADDGLGTFEDASVAGNVLANDGDPDGDPLAIVAVNGLLANVGVAVAGSAGGTFTIQADGTIAFDPGTDFDHLAAGQTQRPPSPIRSATAMAVPTPPR